MINVKLSKANLVGLLDACFRYETTSRDRGDDRILPLPTNKLKRALAKLTAQAKKNSIIQHK